jgi:phosphate:Na+ symporter
MVPGALWAANAANGELAWGRMVIDLFGGLALFLLGMEMMATSLRRAAGERMKSILGKLTATPLMGAATGAAVTAVIQSSSVTTVLVVGFVTANLMTLSQAVGVIMGANIGTTITAQIVAFKVTKWALLLVAVGFSLQFFVKREWVRDYGGIVLGLGLVFFGMAVMGDAMRPLRSYPPFLELMTNMDHAVLAIFVGAAFTALVQSSSATTGIVIVLASQGFISLPAGIALIFGANIGTCVTAMLAAIGKPRTAVQAALVHVLFNIMGVLLWVGFIDYLAQMVTLISPQAGGTEGTARLAAETPRQIANAHTIFNIANTVIFIGFSAHFARLVKRILPDLPEDTAVIKPKHLDDLLLETPALALDAVRRELQRVGQRVGAMMEASLPALLHGSTRQLDDVAQMDNEVDILHGHVIKYLGEISKQNLSQAQTAEWPSTPHRTRHY